VLGQQRLIETSARVLEGQPLAELVEQQRRLPARDGAHR
jgi:hypothetical protein